MGFIANCCGGPEAEPEIETYVDPLDLATQAIPIKDKNRNNGVEKAMSNDEKFSDFNSARDDVKKLNMMELQLLNRYQRFEKKFPFYLMDINGF